MITTPWAFPANPMQAMERDWALLRIKQGQKIHNLAELEIWQHKRETDVCYTIEAGQRVIRVEKTSFGGVQRLTLTLMGNVLWTTLARDEDLTGLVLGSLMSIKAIQES